MTQVNRVNWAAKSAQVSEQSLISDDTWHLVLSTEFSSLLHPGREHTVMDGDNLGWSEAKATGPVRPIIVIVGGTAYRPVPARRPRGCVGLQRGRTELHNVGVSAARVA